MRVTDLVVEVRDSSLARVGQILPLDLPGFTAVLRFNAPGTWSIPLRTSNPLADSLRAPGAGIIVTGPNGVLFSGPTVSAKRSQSREDPEGTWEISGVTDEVILGERLAYPTPASADVTLQTSEFDTRTGTASTVLYGYVSANIGTTAPTARKISNLTLAADPAIGSTITGKARFESLGALLTKLAMTDRLGFTIKQVGSNLQFAVYQPTDRSSYVRMDIDNNLLSKSEYTYTAPLATRVIVAGSGAGATRTLAEVTTSLSTGAETAWGRRIELFKDSRSNSDSTALTQAGTEELADKGKTLEAISASPTDDSTMAYGTDWNLGDKVSVVVGSTTIAQIVTEVGIKVDPDGIRIGATIGEPSVADEESTVADVQADQEERITNLEVNAPASAGSTVTPSDGTVTTAKLADNSVTSAKIVDGTIVNADINASAAIATSKISGLDTALAGKASTASVALKADIASPTLTGTVTAPALRLTSTGDASATSTTHGLEIGDAAQNMRFDGNEISSFASGASAAMFINPDGGTVYIGSTNTASFSVSGNCTVGGNIYGNGKTSSTNWQSVAGTMMFGNTFFGTEDGGNPLALSRMTSNGTIAQFYRGSTTIVGTISVTTTATAYNTSSDYRLKENIVGIDGACERVMALKPIRYNFISEPDEIVDGFLAHEVQEVIPNAVTGSKDEIGEDGEPIYQAIDHSKLVPLLTAALQTALDRIDSLESRLSVLENR